MVAGHWNRPASARDGRVPANDSPGARLTAAARRASPRRLHATVQRLGVRLGAQGPADDEALDLARAFEDRVELGVAVPLLDGEVLDVPPAAQRLDGLL